MGAHELLRGCWEALASHLCALYVFQSSMQNSSSSSLCVLGRGSTSSFPPGRSIFSHSKLALRLCPTIRAASIAVMLLLSSRNSTLRVKF